MIETKHKRKQAETQVFQPYQSIFSVSALTDGKYKQPYLQQYKRDATCQQIGTWTKNCHLLLLILLYIILCVGKDLHNLNEYANVIL